MYETLLVTIDALLNRQVNAILHHPDFQKMEASWRGLSYLLDREKNIRNLKIRVLDISWAELSRDLMNAIDFDQSQLFKKIYTNEFDQPGGHPFGLLICDYFVNPKQDNAGSNDVYALRALAGIAASSFSPCLIGLDPQFFGVSQLSDLESLVDFSRIFEHLSYDKWKKIRQDADARFINLMLIRFCLRIPYVLMDDRSDDFCFQEDAYEHNHYLWGNSAYCLAGVCIRSFEQTGWFYEIKGTRKDALQGGLVEGLIPHYFEDDVSPFYAKPPCETVLRYTHEIELQNLGFIILSRCTYSPFCVFYACKAFYQRSKDQVALSLDTILCVSRFAHYLKVIGRQKIGSLITRDGLQNYLQSWILQYTSNAAGEATPDFTAKYPLSAANVTVLERPTKPGHFYGAFNLTPHHFQDQLDENLFLEMSLS